MNCILTTVWLINSLQRLAEMGGDFYNPCSNQTKFVSPVKPGNHYGNGAKQLRWL